MYILGSFSVLKYLIGVTTRVRRSDQENNQDPPRPHPAQYVINCFLCAWFITGTIEIKSIAFERNIILTNIILITRLTSFHSF